MGVHVGSMNGNTAASTSGREDGWLVVWTGSRAERKVEARIVAMGIEAWLPTVTERHRWSDRWRELVLPLFPGYIFARAAAATWHQLLRTPGVLTVVKDGGRPALLTDAFMASLRQAVECSRMVAERVTELVEYSPGDEVIVQEGALAGVRGVVQERRSGRQLVIWVQEIGRGVAFTIGSALVSRCSSAGV
ncbi:UpxY family transcription antiterminator [soil metagenome]